MTDMLEIDECVCDLALYELWEASSPYWPPPTAVEIWDELSGVDE